MNLELNQLINLATKQAAALERIAAAAERTNMLLLHLLPPEKTIEFLREETKALAATIKPARKR